MPNLMLISRSERLLQLSAGLYTKVTVFPLFTGGAVWSCNTETQFCALCLLFTRKQLPTGLDSKWISVIVL